MKLRPLPPDGEEVFAAALRERADGAVELMTTLRYDADLKHLTRRVPIALEDSDDDVFFLSKLHHQRLAYGAKLLGWPIRVSHTAMVAAMHSAVAQAAPAEGEAPPQRVRVTVNSDGELRASATPVPLRDNLFSGLGTSRSDPVFEVVLVQEETKPAVTNMVKTTDRRMYDEVREVYVTDSASQATASKAGSSSANSGAQDETQSQQGQQPSLREAILIGTRGELLEGTMTSVAIETAPGEWTTPRLANGGMVGVTRSFLLELGYVREGTVYAKNLHSGQRVLLSNGVIGVCAGTLRL